MSPRTRTLAALMSAATATTNQQERAGNVTRLMEDEKLARDREGVAGSASRLAREREEDQRERAQEHAERPRLQRGRQQR